MVTWRFTARIQLLVTTLNIMKMDNRLLSLPDHNAAEESRQSAKPHYYGFSTVVWTSWEDNNSRRHFMTCENQTVSKNLQNWCNFNLLKKLIVWFFALCWIDSISKSVILFEGLFLPCLEGKYLSLGCLER